MLQAELRVVGGKHDAQIIPLSTHKFLIGRERDCQLRPGSELVSRHHCVFTIDEFTVRLRDLGSTNGTYLNRQRVRGEVLLKSGDRVHIGKLDFVVVIRQVAAEEQPLVAESDETEPEAADVAARETAHLSAASESTIFDLPVMPSLADSDPKIDSIDGDTTIISQPPVLPPQAAETYQQPPAQYPQAPVPYPQQPGGAYQQPPMPAQQPGVYPQQPGTYPQQPGIYPQQPGVYPQPGAMPQSMPAQNAAYLPTPPVKLPEPETTGAVEPTEPTRENQAQPADDQAADDQSADENKNPSEKAADIIKQYMQRRPEA